MVRITIELIRKRSEHNEGEIASLEEITLHQEDIEKIEHIDRWCRNLKILLLQYNLISKIENLGMLKKLEYLNLALNNIEVIENLEGLESLKKLDLTVNFIGDLRGIKSLRENEHLESLILTGNPFTDYEGYREYVVATLPQLKELDMAEISRSERIIALQRYAEASDDVLRGYWNYAKIRKEQILRHQRSESVRISELNEDGTEKGGEDDEERSEKFWKSTSSHTPEDRIAIARENRRNREKRERKDDEAKKPKYIPKLFNSDGRPFNINQPKVPFRLDDESDRDKIILDIAVYKHLDTSFLDVDVQPGYVRVTIKGKILQLTLSSEVLTEKSTVQRSQTTGHLVVTMPRLNPLKLIAKPEDKAKKSTESKPIKSVKAQSASTRREFLEIGPEKDDLDYTRIVDNNKKHQEKNKLLERHKDVCRPEEKIPSNDFVDNPDVPPLM
ncbi:protein tilB-like [Neodiprion fabricii]|uniref:protein tilB-like n=1 Tax=Neodiprion fabricii TaxID=2872261 RepID=UPI001ED8E091|nr:protein tilB-like [Neodiprion fabricii]XP_046419328.1 protein tilB-like [Neodiprion fabricii]